MPELLDLAPIRARAERAAALMRSAQPLGPAAVAFFIEAACTDVLALCDEAERLREQKVPGPEADGAADDVALRHLLRRILLVAQDPDRHHVDRCVEVARLAGQVVRDG